ncbi:MAG: dihydrolipoamide acetyltransferase family protein, partial [Flavobacteriales bacterium]
MGESVAEATIIRWLKKEGDVVKADEPIIEIATDKVDSEVPSPEDGVLTSCLVKENEVVLVGQPIAIISTSAVTAPVVHVATNTSTPVEVKSAPIVAPAASASAAPVASSEDRFYSPLVKNIAKQENISQAELDSLSGSGQGGRVTKSDILNYIKNRGAGKPVAIETPQPKIEVRSEAHKPAKSAVSIGAHDEVIEMDRMRKLIAEHMVMSKQTSPHVTSYVEVDVTNIVLWRERVKKAFEAKEKTKITYTPIFIEALVRAIKDFPMINVSVSGSTIIKRKDINIGMATALPSGNLIVPVIKNADQLNLVGL